VSSSFVCGALAFLIILPFSLRALSSRLVRAPSAAQVGRSLRRQEYIS